jgi:DNA-binding MarR family transcriptional regulator
MPPPRRSKTEAAEALAAAAPLATRWIERLLAQHDPPLTVTQYLALRAIASERISATELARRAGVSGPAVSQLLAGLADA